MGVQTMTGRVMKLLVPLAAPLFPFAASAANPVTTHDASVISDIAYNQMKKCTIRNGRSTAFGDLRTPLDTAGNGPVGPS